MRTKQLISYATLNDAHGDTSKHWYIDYSFRLPNEDKVHRYRVYNGLCSGTAEQRRRRAYRMIRKINDYLKSGEYLNHDLDYSPVLSHEDFRPEAKRLKEIERSRTISHLMPDYVKDIQARLRKKSWQTYKSKLDCFQEYVTHDLKNMPVTKIQRVDVLPFFSMLATDKQMSVAGIKGYIVTIHRFFEWLEDIEVREVDSNPIKKIPNYGRVIDRAPEPFTPDEAYKLRQAIAPENPYLWLMCMMQYYCCFRPGTELRLLKVGDICIFDHTITIRAEYTKQKQTVTVKIPDIVYNDIERLRIMDYPSDYYVFSSDGIPSRRPIGYNTMRVRFNQYRDALHISNTKTFYSWKHTGAISAYRNGANMSEIQDLLHHSWIGSTEHYLKKRMKRIDTGAKFVQDITKGASQL